MQRFFIERPLREVEIFEDEIFHQVTRVLRMQKGDKIILFCGDGIEYLYELTNFSKNFAISVFPNGKSSSSKNAFSGSFWGVFLCGGCSIRSILFLSVSNISLEISPLRSALSISERSVLSERCVSMRLLSSKISNFFSARICVFSFSNRSTRFSSALRSRSFSSRRRLRASLYAHGFSFISRLYQIFTKNQSNFDCFLTCVFEN